MKTRILPVLLAFVALLPLAKTLEARELVDQVGRRVEVPDRPARIISLMPSLTEIVYELGAGERLVGATQYSTSPPPAARLPRVGSYVHLDVEKIVRLRPDLCLAVRDGNPLHVIERLESLAIPVYTVDPRDLTEIIESIELLGEALAREQEAGRLAGEMRHRLKAVTGKVAGIGSRPGVFFQIDAAPIISAGTDTFIDHLINRAGGRNLAAGPTRYPRYSWEDILVMEPEVVIIASMAGGFSEEELKASWQKWPQIPAVKNRRLFVVEADLFDRPTPRMIEGLETLLPLIHPELAP